MSGNSEQKVNVVRLLAVNLNMGSKAAVCAISHGQVSIDGHTITMAWAVNHWTEDQLRGRMLKCGNRECRILGSRLAPPDFEQTQIAV